MNVFDLVIVLLLVTSVGGGWRMGLLTGATSWVLLIQSLVLVTLLLPSIATAVGGNDAAVRLLVAVLLFVGAGFAGQRAGILLGSHYRRAILPADGEARRYDRVAGAAVAPLAVLVALWLLVLPPLSHVSGSLAGLTRHSVLVRAIEAAFPEPPETSQALRRLAGPAGTPHVFDGLIPSIETGPPPRDAGLSREVVVRVSASTVKVEGVACGFERDGSGFAIGPDLVATNAHVIAGQRRTTVVRADGRRLRAQVVAFDPGRDLALLEVPGLGQPPLPLGTGKIGTIGAVFGHPGGQSAVKVSPADLRQQVNSLGPDLYDLSLVRRTVYVLAADLAPGDSGGALVNAQGEVVGVAFAISPDDDRTAYALVASKLRSVLESPRTTPVSAGLCIG